MKTFLKYIFLLLLVNIYSQQNSNHIPWKLEGANERIEKYRKGKVKLEFKTDEELKERQATVNIQLTDHDFKFGVSFTQLRRFWGDDFGKTYLNRVKEVFNYATIGMYWQLTDERIKNNKMVKYYEEVIEWADKNNFRLKGHPLMWHEAMPDWVRNFKNLDKLDGLIKNHMKRLIETYPEINDWDVYNEPIGPFKPHIPPSAITEWIKMKGGIYPAMVEIYEFVDNVDPTKNYSNNHYHAKDPEFLKINNFFVEKNLNFSSIGMQAHMQTNDNVMSESQLWNQIKNYEGLGKKIQFTEITVTSSERFNNWKEHQAFLKKRDEVMSNGGVMNLPSLPEYENFQADYLKDFYTLAFSHPSVSSITFWNLTDKNAWRGHAGGLLFDDLKPKKAFNELKKLIKTTWTTKIFESNIDLKKGVDFNGFYGKYEGEVIIENIKYPFEFHHSPEQKDKVIVVNIN